MTEVIGVRFREVGTIETYSVTGEQFRRGDHVLCETQCGVEYGTVILGNYTLCGCKAENPPQSILARATEEDAARAAAYKSKEREALLFCRKKAEELGLNMKIISAVFSLRDDKVLFFFSAEARVDFRVLVKEHSIRDASNFAKSARETRPNCSAAWEIAAVRSAAIPISRSLCRCRLRWQKSRDLRSIRKKSAGPAAVSCAA